MRAEFKKPRKARKAAAKKPLEKTITAVVKAVEKRSLETKYCASNRTDNQAVTATAATPAQFIILSTPVTQGTDDHQRIGDVIEPVVCKAYFTFYFANTSQNNEDLIVNFWVVRSKSAKGAQQVGTLTGGNFLKLGTGVNVDPINPSQPSQLSLVQHYPLNRDAYIPLMHKKFRMRRGIGQSCGINTSNEVAPTGTAASEDLHTVVFSWNPAKWNFDNTIPAPWQNYPTNDAPVALIWATNADGSGGSTSLVHSLRTEVYYKDG